MQALHVRIFLWDGHSGFNRNEGCYHDAVYIFRESLMLYMVGKTAMVRKAAPSLTNFAAKGLSGEIFEPEIRGFVEVPPELIGSAKQVLSAEENFSAELKKLWKTAGLK